MAIELNGTLLRERHVETGNCETLCLFSGRAVVVVDTEEVDGEPMWICEVANARHVRFHIDMGSVELSLPATALVGEGTGGRAAPERVFVVMGNDFPDAVFSEEAVAEAFCKMRRAVPGSRIYWRVYDFELDGALSRNKQAIITILAAKREG